MTEIDQDALLCWATYLVVEPSVSIGASLVACLMVPSAFDTLRE